MLCQSCLKNMATTHIKTIVNGEFKEYMLCPECAKEMGCMNLFDEFVSDFGNLWSSFLDAKPLTEALPKVKRCDFCGASFNDIVNTGRVGCAHCYETFSNEILPSIQRIHGNTRHKGKIASSGSAESKLKNQVEDLKEKLSQAIQNQEFEEAAKLRDKIREIEGRVKNND